MASALLDTTSLDAAFATSDSPAATGQSAAGNTEDLRRQVAERLAAHRSRRNNGQSQSVPTHSSAQPHTTRSSRIAATVAQRYANSPSYREVLAAEAERATQQARAAAEVAARNAQAVAAAQMQLIESLQQEAARQQEEAQQAREAPQSATQPQLESQPHPIQNLSLWPDPVEPAESSRSFTPPKPARRPAPAHHASAKSLPPRLTVRLYEDESSAAHVELRSPLQPFNPSRKPQPEGRSIDEERALDEEIAFRQSPVFEEPVGPAMSLPANLIEFPRQLVAARKARPRYVEGPLRAEVVPAPGEKQLRIFEVDPAQISTTPAIADAPTPQWTSLWLDTPEPTLTESDEASHLASSSSSLLSSRSVAEGSASPYSASTLPLIDAASIPRRLMAATLDGAILLAAFGTFAATSLFVAVRSLLPHSAAPQSLSQIAANLGSQTGLQLRPALVVFALVFALLYLLYQTLFFTFSESTPGMRAVRIALCTFDDENPTRRALRRRILAVLLSVIPFGFGLLWATLDEDGLAWHDRITRTYQRTY
jgi:uncharacterized RDD family membrane protein YckC